MSISEISKRLLVVSDSHGNYIKLNNIIREAGFFDVMIHCGDGANDLVHASVPEGIVRYTVSGNIDLMRMTGLERNIEFTVEGLDFLVTHGDLYRVKYGFDEIIKEGISREADIVIFGHTHNQYIKESPPVLFNPGAANRGQYGIIEVNSKSEVSFQHYTFSE